MVTKELILRMAEKQKNEILSRPPKLEVNRDCLKNIPTESDAAEKALLFAKT